MVAMPTVVMKLIDRLRDTDAFAMFWQPGVIVPHDHAACSQHVERDIRVVAGVLIRMVRVDENEVHRASILAQVKLS